MVVVHVNELATFIVTSPCRIVMLTPPLPFETILKFALSSTDTEESLRVTPLAGLPFPVTITLISLAVAVLVVLLNWTSLSGSPVNETSYVVTDESEPELELLSQPASIKKTVNNTNSFDLIKTPYEFVHWVSHNLP